MRRKLILFLSLLLVGSATIADDLLSDDAINARVQANIANYAVTADLPITVSTDRRVVKLSGDTDTANHAMTLIEIAESTKGVRDVDTSELTIRATGRLATDNTLTAKVIGTIIRERVYGDNIDIYNFPLSVSTVRGVVTIIGQVNGRRQIDECINLAAAIPGVQRVVSGLVIRQVPAKTG